MTDQSFVYVAFVLDETGSMLSLMPEPLTGFNAFLQDQKALSGKCTLRLTTFNSGKFNTQEKPMNEFEPLTTQSYVPAGLTPLYDSVSRTIDEVGKSLSEMPEGARPGKVVFVILTDGLENASREVTQAEMRSKVTRQSEQYGWEFLYLGVGLDKMTHEAQSTGAGVKAAQTQSFANTPAGMQASYRSASLSVSHARTGGTGTSDPD